MTLSLVIFDMDGTLIDSGDLIVDAMRTAFLGEGLDSPSDRAIRRIVGLELYEAVRVLDPSLAETLNRRVGDAYKAAFVAARSAGGGEASAPMYPGARAAIERLAATDTLLGVATGKARRGLDHTLESHGLRRFFQTTQTCTENPGKPHPGMIESALRDTGAEAARTVMVGDTTFDMQMARNAGAAALGVAWGYHEAEELLEAGATRVLGGFDELDQALGELLAR
ncbi:MAG: HAD-IA family hydrolase [Pseudomonadota bacterium]